MHGLALSLFMIMTFSRIAAAQSTVLLTGTVTIFLARRGASRMVISMEQLQLRYIF